MVPFRVAQFCRLLSCLGMAMVAAPDVHAESGMYSNNERAPIAGQRFAVRMCAQCHDVQTRHDDVDSTSNPPSFHAIANASTTTAMGLNAFLQSPHTDMPNLIIAPRDRRNVIAYILSLRDAHPSVQ